MPFPHWCVFGALCHFPLHYNWLGVNNYNFKQKINAKIEMTNAAVTGNNDKQQIGGNR